MRVGVDARHLAGGRGVAHYTSEILGALARDVPGDEWHAYVPRGGPQPPPGVRVARGALPSQAVFGAAALLGRPALDTLVGGEVDVVWIPAPAPVAISAGVPTVVTVHDLSWVEHPEWFTRYERLWHRLGRLERLAAGASRVVAVSRATAAAVARHWPSVDPARVRVVPSGVRDLGPPAPSPRRDDPYVLFVGALEPRKDPELLARAFARARREGLQARLVFAGRGRLAERLRGDGVEVLGEVDDARLAALYAGALAVAVPSLREGFGFVPLEAAAAGTPSIVAADPVFDETLGDAAVRAPAGDEEAWARALLELAGDPERRAALGERAREAAARRTWAAAARGLHDALREAADGA